MKNILKAIIAFVIGGFLGFLIESVNKGTFAYSQYFNMTFGINVPFIFLYGIGLIIVIFLRDFLKENNINIFIRLPIITFAIVLLELFSGIIATEINNGYRFWDYSDHLFNFNGYISLQIAIVFVLFL